MTTYDNLCSAAAVNQMRSSHAIVVSEYQTLQTFVASVRRICSDASEVIGQTDATFRLLTFLEDVREKTWSDMKALLSTYVFIMLSAEPFIISSIT